MRRTKPPKSVYSESLIAHRPSGTGTADGAGGCGPGLPPALLRPSRRVASASASGSHVQGDLAAGVAPAVPGLHTRSTTRRTPSALSLTGRRRRPHWPEGDGAHGCCPRGEAGLWPPRRRRLGPGLPRPAARPALTRPGPAGTRGRPCRLRTPWPRCLCAG